MSYQVPFEHNLQWIYQTDKPTNWLIKSFGSDFIFITKWKGIWIDLFTKLKNKITFRPRHGNLIYLKLKLPPGSDTVVSFSQN